MTRAASAAAKAAGATAAPRGSQNISLVQLLNKLKPSCNPEQWEQLDKMYVELKVRPWM